MDAETEKRLFDAKIKAAKAEEFKARYLALRKEIQTYFELYDEDFDINNTFETAIDEPGRIEYEIKWADKDERDRIEKERTQHEFEEKMMKTINFLIAHGKVLGKDFTFADAFEKAKEVAQNDTPQS